MQARLVIVGRSLILVVPPVYRPTFDPESVFNPVREHSGEKQREISDVGLDGEKFTRISFPGTLNHVDDVLVGAHIARPNAVEAVGLDEQAQQVGVASRGGFPERTTV